MLQAFIVVLREGFEAFIIVALILAYLKRTAQQVLVPAVYWGIAVSVLSSAVLGFYLFHESAQEPLMEGWLGLISAVLVGGLVIHMWRTAPRLKQEMENRLIKHTEGKSLSAAFLGVLIFTVFMITREGMETALLLIQIHEPRIVTGITLGALTAASMALLWVRFSRFINLKVFFQVTSIYLLLFVVQILIYSFHEFTEAGAFHLSEALHEATEPFSPDGLYGKWFSPAMILICGLWLLGARITSKLFSSEKRVGI